MTSLGKSTTDGPACGLTLQTQWLRPRISDFFFLPPSSFSSQAAPETAGYVWEAFSNPCDSFIVSIQLDFGKKKKKNLLTTSLDGTHCNNTELNNRVEAVGLKSLLVPEATV